MREDRGETRDETGMGSGSRHGDGAGGIGDGAGPRSAGEAAGCRRCSAAGNVSGCGGARPGVRGGGRPFRQGRAALEKKQYAEAAKELGLAYAVLPRAQIAGKLGEAELQLGRYRDAAEHLEKFLRDGGDQIIPAYRKSAEGWFATAKKNVATLKVTVTPPPGAAQGWDSGQEWLVDGVVSALKGPLPPEVFVEPGKRTLVVRVGAVRAEVTGQYEKGMTQDVKLAPVAVETPGLVAAGNTNTSGSPSGAGPAAQTGGPNVRVVVAGGVVAGAALVAGVIFAVLSDGKTAAVQTAREGVANGECADAATTPGCKDLFWAKDERNALATASLWSFVGAAAVGGGTAAYWLLTPRQKDTTTGALRAGVVVTPAGGGLTVHGAW